MGVPPAYRCTRGPRAQLLRVMRMLKLMWLSVSRLLQHWETAAAHQL